MSRYANKVEKIESGNWVMKSLVLLGGWILGMVAFGLLETLGTAVGLGFLETAAGAVSGVLFVAYLVLTLALYTVTGIWGYIGHLFKEAFLLPWKFTPRICIRMDVCGNPGCNRRDPCGGSGAGSAVLPAPGYAPGKKSLSGKMCAGLNIKSKEQINQIIKKRRKI